MENKIDHINEVVLEARRFIQKALAWKKRIKKDQCVLIFGSKEGATAKRASMDLTRCLTQFRSLAKFRE